MTADVRTGPVFRQPGTLLTDHMFTVPLDHREPSPSSTGRGRGRGRHGLFTGEMIYPWMFETDPVLRPLRDAAEELAQRGSRPRRYDPARLAATGVPAAAAVYYEDMYVPLALSVPTAADATQAAPPPVRANPAWISSCDQATDAR